MPEAPAGTSIEPGTPVRLDARQQEAVVTGLSPWLKTPGAASFGSMSAVRLRQGRIAVCGEVNARNATGAYAGPARFVGVMMGSSRAPEFVVVALAQSGKARIEVDAICSQSGAV